MDPMIANLLASLESLASIPAISCAYPSCNTDNDLKLCAACGLISYCCKDHQKIDWSRHKCVCKMLRPLKSQVLHLNQPLKQVIDRISIKLPQINSEYVNMFPRDKLTVVANMWISGGLVQTKDMIMTNIPNLLKTDNSQESTLKRWQEISPELGRFLSGDSNIGDVFKEKGYHPYNPGAPQQFRNSPSPDQPALANG